MRTQQNNHNGRQPVTVMDIVRKWGDCTAAFLLTQLARDNVFEFDRLTLNGTLEMYRLVIEMELD